MISYDFYAEFWDEQKIDNFIKNFMMRVWSEIWNDRNIKIKDKKKNFEQKTIENLLKGLYVQFTKAEPFVSPVNFVMFLKEMESYIQRKKKYFDDFGKKELKKEYYETGNKKINYPELPDELVKKTYTEIFKYFPVSEKIKGLTEPFDFKEYSEFSILPSYTLFLSVDFTLKKPYISRDDEEFYIIDNPVCKDKVFKVPLVRPTSWRGALRHAAIREAFKEFDKLSDDKRINKRLILFRLFGNEKDKVKEYLDELFGEELKRKFEEELRRYYKKMNDQEINVRGRLVFYPTFFNLIGLDIIAPHDRETRTVKVPIQFEVVPRNAKGTFSLLYFPFDLIWHLYSEDKGEKDRAIKEIKEDWEILAEAIPEMLTKWGVGAKTTAGYGIANIEKIEVNGQECGTDWSKVLEAVKNGYGG